MGITLHAPSPTNLLSNVYDIRCLVLAVFFSYIAYKAYRSFVFTYGVRHRYRDIPSYPRHWFGGNLKNVGEKLSPSIPHHPDYGMEDVWNNLNQPPCFLIDLAPVDYAMLIITHPSVAEAVTQPSPEYKYSVPKSDTLQNLVRLIGSESIIMAEGEEWRALRRRFNKGFSPAHMHTLSPLVISKTRVFIDKLQDAAKTGKALTLKDLTQDLTTDVITQLTIEKDFHSQTVPEGEGPKSAFGVLTAARMLSSLAFKGARGFDPILYLDLARPTKAWLYERIYNNELYSLLSRKISAMQQPSEKRNASAKAIVQLALADLTPSASLLRNTVAQMKSFLFAGQDTTATSIQWLCYELSKAEHDPRYAKILRKLQAEHDSIFGPGVFSALDILEQPGKAAELLGDKISYTTAFIKENLRLHPPAGTARLIPPASDRAPPYSVDIDGRSTRIDGLRLYICQWIVHRNPKVWGEDANVFKPDRWLDEEYVRKLPPGAWRPFERGPRNCIGQELAMMEAKIVLCAVARGLRFEKVGYTGRNGEEEMFYINQVTSIPVDGMVMKVHERS